MRDCKKGKEENKISRFLRVGHINRSIKVSRALLLPPHDVTADMSEIDGQKLIKVCSGTKLCSNEFDKHRFMLRASCMRRKTLISAREDEKRLFGKLCQFLFKPDSC